MYRVFSKLWCNTLESNSTCKNESKKKNKIFPCDAPFLRKSSLKIYSVHLNLANYMIDKNN